MMNTLLCVSLESEDLVGMWLLTHFPTLATCLAVIAVSVWITWWWRGLFNDHKNRFMKIEADVQKLEKNQRIFRRKLNRMDKKITTIENKVTSLDHKLDQVIIYIHSTTNTGRV